MADIKLPTAWREIPPTWEDGDFGDPKDAEPIIVEELRCWVRGDRYVRVVKVSNQADYPFQLRCGWAAGGGREYTCASAAAADGLGREALKAMAFGGDSA